MPSGQSDLLWDVVGEAMAPVAEVEPEWEMTKLTRRIREYFRKAAKGLDFRKKPWNVLVNEYADCAFGTIFQALGDREWLERMDFIFILDAGVKDMFPSALLAQVPPIEFERTVLAAHDRAFEEQRYLPILWVTVQKLDVRLRKEIYRAGEVGRRDAAAAWDGSLGPDVAKDFVSRWIDATVKQLRRASRGHPATLLPEASCVELFHALLKANTLPIAVEAVHGPPPRAWPFVDFSVRAAYAAHSAVEARRRPPPPPPGGHIIVTSTSFEGKGQRSAVVNELAESSTGNPTDPGAAESSNTQLGQAPEIAPGEGASVEEAPSDTVQERCETQAMDDVCEPEAKKHKSGGLEADRVEGAPLVKCGADPAIVAEGSRESARGEGSGLEWPLAA